MMKISLKVFKEEELLEENASYSLGWLEIIDGANEIFLFKDKLCMIFITTSFLVDHIQHLESNKVKEARWVGEDHGAVFMLTIDKNEICIKDKNIRVLINFQNFRSSLIEGISNFLGYCLEVNPDIEKESAFIDLNASLIKLKS